MKKKIVIIGAGPIGCYSAQVLKTYGFEPLLIEEHIEVGRPIHCTGLVGSKVFEEKRPFRLPSSSIINTINGAVLHYDSQSFSIERKKVAYVINRERFDKDLSLGLNILYQNKFLNIEKTRSGYVVGTDKEEIPADIVIGADGANSLVRKIINQDTNIQHYRGAQFRIRTKLRRMDFVEVYLKKPTFFWVVPEGENIVRVGTISENPYKDLQGLLKETKIKGELIERFGGLVAVGICNNTTKDNIMLVGDAACQLKPLSYGGIYFGLKSATILANCIKENRIKDYDSLWKKEFISEIRIGLKAKAIYNNLDQNELKDIFKLLKSQKKMIERIGDFKSHSRLILEIIRNPGFYTQFGKVLRILLKNIL